MAMWVEDGECKVKENSLQWHGGTVKFNFSLILFYEVIPGQLTL